MTTSISGLPDFDSGAEHVHVEPPHPRLPLCLTLKSSASTFTDPDANYSPYNDDLLTPPLTNPSLDEPPFRPAESDRTSLSMKRRHSSSRRRRIHNRACVSSGDIDQTAIFGKGCSSVRRLVFRSQSAPNLTKLLRAVVKRYNTREKETLILARNARDEAVFASRRSSLLNQPRRWYVSSPLISDNYFLCLFPIPPLWH
jgi:hypothetical protein